MSFVPNDYEYTRIGGGPAEDGRSWVLKECVDRTEGKGVGFQVITTQRGDAIGESYSEGSAFVGGVVVADGDPLEIEAETTDGLAQELKEAGFSEADVNQIVYTANAMSVNTVRGVK